MRACSPTLAEQHITYAERQDTGRIANNGTRAGPRCPGGTLSRAVAIRGASRHRWHSSSACEGSHAKRELTRQVPATGSVTLGPDQQLVFNSRMGKFWKFLKF